MDLGPDDYDLPGYFSRQHRYAYYRLKTEGHNTLVLGDQNQSPAARAPILGFSSTRDHAFVVADLTEGYAGRAEKVWRGLALLGRQHVLVQDELEAAKPVSVRWGMHTRAEVQLDGRRARLTDGSASLMARILEPAGASFEVAPVTPPPVEIGDVANLFNLQTIPAGVPTVWRDATLSVVSDSSSFTSKSLSISRPIAGVHTLHRSPDNRAV